MFTKATKEQARGRLALFGISGSGKTYTALRIAQSLGQRIAVIDTENGSASKYADQFSFDTAILTSFSPDAYIAAIHGAEAAGYDVLIIDSISHAWMGKDGVLERVDNITARSSSKNAFTTGWREATPQHNRLVEALVQCKCHLIVTCRQKSDWIIDEGANGKKAPRKVGMAPVQREGLEYEFDVAGDMDGEHRLIITKSRCSALADKVFVMPGEDVGKVFADWLNSGAAPSPKPEPPPVFHGQTHMPSDAETVERLKGKCNTLRAMISTMKGDGADAYIATVLESMSKQYGGVAFDSIEALPEKPIDSWIAKLAKQSKQQAAA